MVLHFCKVRQFFLTFTLVYGIINCKHYAFWLFLLALSPKIILKHKKGRFLQMNVTEIIKKLKDRLAKVTEIANSDVSSTEDNTRRATVENALLYKSEMEYLIASIEYIEKVPIFIVTKSTLNKKSAQADFASVEEDGFFYQLVLLRSYPFQKVFLLWVASVSEL